MFLYASPPCGTDSRSFAIAGIRNLASEGISAGQRPGCCRRYSESVAHGAHQLRHPRFRPHRRVCAQPDAAKRTQTFASMFAGCAGTWYAPAREVNPTFDDPESFFLEVKTGVIRANIGDIGNFLNAGGVANSPLNRHLASCRRRPDQAQGDSAQTHSAAGRIARHRGRCCVRQPNSATGHKTLGPETSIERASRRIAHQRSQTSSSPRGFLALKFPATTSFSTLSNCFPRLIFVDN